jgi:hypothetical protein
MQRLHGSEDSAEEEQRDSAERNENKISYR